MWRVENFQMGVTNKTEQYMQRQPFGQVPLLDTPEGPLFESNTLARYVAREGTNKRLYGQSNYQTSIIDQWLDEARSLEPHFSNWIYPLLGYMDYNKEAVEKSKYNAMRMLGIVNMQIQSKGSPFLTSDHVTIADICVYCNLIIAMKNVLSPEIRSTIPAVAGWFARCSEEDNFKSITGDIPLCSSEPTTPIKKS